MLIRIKCPFICTFIHQPHHDFLLSQVHLTCFILICLILSMTEDCSQPLTFSPLKNTRIQYNIFIQKITTHTHHTCTTATTGYVYTHIHKYIYTCMHTKHTHMPHTLQTQCTIHREISHTIIYIHIDGRFTYITSTHNIYHT